MNEFNEVTRKQLGEGLWLARSLSGRSAIMLEKGEAYFVTVMKVKRIRLTLLMLLQAEPLPGFKPRFWDGSFRPRIGSTDWPEAFAEVQNESGRYVIIGGPISGLNETSFSIPYVGCTLELLDSWREAVTSFAAKWQDPAVTYRFARFYETPEEHGNGENFSATAPEMSESTGSKPRESHCRKKEVLKPIQHIELFDTFEVDGQNTYALAIYRGHDRDSPWRCIFAEGAGVAALMIMQHIYGDNQRITSTWMQLSLAKGLLFENSKPFEKNRFDVDSLNKLPVGDLYLNIAASDQDLLNLAKAACEAAKVELLI